MTDVDLLVASNGGHLKELLRLSRRIPDLGECIWATPRNAQTASLLVNEEVSWLPYVRPHDVRGVIAAARALRKDLSSRRLKARRVVTTGASPALSALLATGMGAADFHFIESAARVTQPSVTGRLLQRIPTVHTYSQYEWPARSWRYVGSVFDDFQPLRRAERSIRRVVVTVGMNETYPFPRLIRALQRALPGEAEVIWQVGSVDARLVGTKGRVFPTMPATELAEAMRNADLVVCHAGAGSALTALEAGHVPILVPRSKGHNEHVDDHQWQIAAELQSRGLSHTASVEELSQEYLDRLELKSALEAPGGALQLVSAQSR